MDIRTITVGAREADLERAARAAQEARARLEAAGYTVQTLRLALLQVANTCADFPAVAQGAERQALEAGFDYVSVGPLDHRRLPDLARALRGTETVFASTQIAGVDGTVYEETIRAAAEAIVAVGRATPLGFGNLRFAALAGVGPGTPFFPASYHDTGAPWLAVGPEAARLAVLATADQRPTTNDQRPTTDDHGASGEQRVESSSLSEAEDVVGLVVRPSSFVAEAAASVVRRSSFVAEAALARLTALIEEHDARIGAALAGVERGTGVAFTGCDWSLAPHPDPARSIGAAVEALSGVPFGAWGTLAAVRGLTAAVRAARVTRLGFSGVMLPVLEDDVLARRNREGRYTLRDLLAFSAVCGTGLDTIPLPGDTTPEQVAGVLREVAALSAALRKPLTVRLMPIPGLAAGDLTAFDFAYFVNTRVMAI